jgi:hypothetical protein
MKTKTLKLLFVLCIISLIEIKAQPYIYYSIQLPDTGYERYSKVVRYNLESNSVEDFLPQQNMGEYVWETWDPSQSYLAINVFNWTHTIYDCSDTSRYFEFEDFFSVAIDEMLYSLQRNKLYIFSDDYEKISVLDLSSGQIISETSITGYPDYNDLMRPRRDCFFSSDNTKIYLISKDSLTHVDQVLTYSLESNLVIGSEDLSEIGYSGTDGYDLNFGRDGKGIITSYPNYNNPIKDFYYRIFDFDNDSGSPFIYHNGLSEAYFTGDGEILVIMDTEKDDSLRYYHTGEVEIYDTQNAQLLKTLSLPSRGKVYTFDNYPNNIYYAIDIEEPTRQIYTLKMDSIFNVLYLTSINPSSVVVNSPPFTLTVNGHGFDTLSTIYFNESAKTTTYVSDSVLTAEISTSDISTVGDYPVWAIDQWATSDTITFSVIPHPPVLNSISPAILLRNILDVKPSGLTVTATGENFSDSSVVYFNGNAKATTIISDSVLTFPITGTEMSTLGNYTVWIRAYNTNSDTLNFSVTVNLPQSLTPTLQCVQNNGDHTYTAYLGYNNSNSVSVYISLGSKNNFSPAPIDRGQPKLFLPGEQADVFSVIFNGSDLTWTLDQASVTANKNSTPCP